MAATYWFGRRAFDHRRGLLAAAILITSPLYATMAQVLTTDMLLTALLSVAFFAFFLQWREGGRWWLALYLAAAFAVLTKGPVGVIAAGPGRHRFSCGAREICAAGLGKFHLAGRSAAGGRGVALPWFAAIAIRQPGFFDFYFVGEHFRRVFVSTYSHGEPFYFYLPVILVGLLAVVDLPAVAVERRERVDRRDPSAQSSPVSWWCCSPPPTRS